MPSYLSETGELGSLSMQTEADGSVIIALCGEFDLSNAAGLRQCVAEAFAVGSTEILCDLEYATFIDSTVLSVLISTQNRAVASHVKFALVAPPSRVDRLLEVTGVKSIFTVIPSMRKAGKSPEIPIK